MILLKDLGTDTDFRWGVHVNDECIAQFVYERNADAYTRHLRKVVEKVKG